MICETTPAEVAAYEAEMLRRAKLDELEALEAKAAYLRDHALETYEPHEKQDAFHRSTARFRAFFSGNRGGKSTAGVVEDCSFALGERLFYPKSDPARYSLIPKRPCKILVLTTDWEKVREIFTEDSGENVGKFFKYLPPGSYDRPRRNHAGVIDFIPLKNGSTIYFDTVRSFLSNAQSVESSDHDVIHVDEPIPEAMWKGASRGLLDRLGVAFFSLTPLEEVWITDKFAVGGEDHFKITGTTYDNTTLSATAIAAFEKDLTPEERECRLYGIPLENAGRVYKEFVRDVHVLRSLPQGWTAFNKPTDDCALYVYIDCHPSTPTAISFFAVPPSNDCIIQYDEIFEKGTVASWCKSIHEKLGLTAATPTTDVDGRIGGQQRSCVWARIDPSAFIDNPVFDTNLATAFGEHGVYVEKASKALSHGILEVKERLTRRDHNGNPFLLFSPNLPETLREFERYRWGMEDGVPTNKPHDKDDHMMENLYRMVLDGPEWVPSAGLVPAFKLKDIDYRIKRGGKY